MVRKRKSLAKSVLSFAFMNIKGRSAMEIDRPRYKAEKAKQVKRAKKQKKIGSYKSLRDAGIKGSRKRDDEKIMSTYARIKERNANRAAKVYTSKSGKLSKIAKEDIIKRRDKMVTVRKGKVKIT